MGIGDDYTFIINRVKVSDRGEFIIRAENHYGVTEEPVFLNVQPAPRELPRYEPEPLPVRKREPKTYKLYKEERNSAPMFTFHLHIQQSNGPREEKIWILINIQSRIQTV